MLASETCAFDLVEAEFVRELDPGEIVIIGPEGIKSIKTRRQPGGRSAFLNSSILPDRTALFMVRMFI